MSPEIIQERSKGPLIWPMMPRNRRLGGFFNKQGRNVGAGRIDLLVDDALAPIHRAQLLSYLRITGDPLGLLINFNVSTLKDGIKRIVLSDISPA
jgi:hypothetical protein